MRKKLLSCVLACAMIVTTFLSSVATVSAAGENEAKIGTTEYATLATAIQNAAENDVITVLKDVEISSTVTVNKSITLTAEDAVTIKRAEAFKPALFKVQQATLTLSGNLTLEGHTDAYGSLILCTLGSSKAASSLVMEDGVTLKNNQHPNTTYGGAITLDGAATFTMNGGTITNCGVAKFNSTGGAVRAAATSTGCPTITMNGGTISDCFAFTGGAIYLSGNGKSAASFTMNGGTISGCFAGKDANTVNGYGGAIYLYNKTNTDAKMTTATINDGEITGCKAYKYGILGMESGITRNPYNGGTYYILGGHIYNNSVGYNGESSEDPGKWYGESVYIQGLSKTGESLLVLGGDAVIEDEVYLSKNSFIDVRDDFTGVASMYVQLCTEDQTVLRIVNADGEVVTEPFDGMLALTNPMFGENGNYMRDANGNIVPKFSLVFDSEGNVSTTPYTCTVLYTDGVDDEVVFEDQYYSVTPGTQTPAFVGTPEREGYTFMGWSPAVEETATTSVVYVAQWKANTYTVTFNTNGGSALENDSMTVTYDSAFGTLPVVTREGYEFLGWYDADDNLVTADTICKLTADATLTAKWNVKSFTVTFVADGKVVSTLNVEYNTILTSADCPTVPAKEGYTGQWKLPTTGITEDTEIVAEYTAVTPSVDTDDSMSVVLPVALLMMALLCGVIWFRQRKRA